MHRGMLTFVVYPHQTGRLPRSGSSLAMRYTPCRPQRAQRGALEDLHEVLDTLPSPNHPAHLRELSVAHKLPFIYNEGQRRPLSMGNVKVRPARALGILRVHRNAFASAVRALSRASWMVFLETISLSRWTSSSMSSSNPSRPCASTLLRPHPSSLHRNRIQST